MTKEKPDALICLGDIVGYGPNPNECLLALSRFKARMIRGNHDRVVITGDYTNFTEEAAETAQWTASNLTQETRKILEGLTAGPALVDGRFTVCHGSPHNEDDYIDKTRKANLAFPWLQETGSGILFCGHTHMPAVYQYGPADGKTSEVQTRSLVLQDQSLYIINPGSLGQPRDGSSRPSYAVYDTEASSVSIRRFEYPLDRTMKKMLMRNLHHDTMLVKYMKNGR